MINLQVLAGVLTAVHKFFSPLVWFLLFAGAVAGSAYLIHIVTPTSETEPSWKEGFLFDLFEPPGSTQMMTPRLRIVDNSGSYYSADIWLMGMPDNLPLIESAGIDSSECRIYSGESDGSYRNSNDERNMHIFEHTFDMNIYKHFGDIRRGNEFKSWDIFRLVPNASVKKDRPVLVEIICDLLNVEPAHTSFLDRRLVISPDDYSSTIKTGDKTDYKLVQNWIIDLHDLEDFDGFRVTGSAYRLPPDALSTFFGRPDSPEATRLVYGKRNIKIEWRDPKLSSMRDVLLLAAGAFLGLAGAAFVEWLRPHVEWS
jgi:hypothetical protein